MVDLYALVKGYRSYTLVPKISLRNLLCDNCEPVKLQYSRSNVSNVFGRTLQSQRTILDRITAFPKRAQCHHLTRSVACAHSESSRKTSRCSLTFCLNTGVSFLSKGFCLLSHCLATYHTLGSQYKKRTELAPCVVHALETVPVTNEC